MSRKQKHQHPDIFDSEAPSPRKKLSPLMPQTERQSQLLNCLVNKQLTFAVGPAGTGKTYIATRFACELLEDKEIEKIIITRPMVSAEDDIGFLPGKVEDKFAPYFAPIREIMNDHLGASHVQNLLKLGRVEIAPVGFLRGHTFKNCFVLFDEAQNTSPGQMKLFLTRIGEGATICVDGDLAQVDIDGPSGLHDAVSRFGRLEEVGLVRFRNEDIVRSGLARKIVEGYSK